jgi:hypothetical protein
MPGKLTSSVASLLESWTFEHNGDLEVCMSTGPHSRKLSLTSTKLPTVQSGKRGRASERNNFDAAFFKVRSMTVDTLTAGRLCVAKSDSLGARVRLLHIRSLDTETSGTDLNRNSSGVASSHREPQKLHGNSFSYVAQYAGQVGIHRSYRRSPAYLYWR